MRASSARSGCWVPSCSSSSTGANKACRCSRPYRGIGKRPPRRCCWRPKNSSRSRNTRLPSTSTGPAPVSPARTCQVCRGNRPRSALSASLPHDLIEQDGPGDGGIEGTHLPEHREADEGIGLLAQEIVQPLAFGTDDEHQRPAAVELPVQPVRVTA